jgi:hypothetical protein
MENCTKSGLIDTVRVTEAWPEERNEENRKKEEKEENESERRKDRL